jgi:hypothetical protein
MEEVPITKHGSYPTLVITGRVPVISLREALRFSILGSSPRRMAGTNPATTVVER